MWCVVFTAQCCVSAAPKWPKTSSCRFKVDTFYNFHFMLHCVFLKFEFCIFEKLNNAHHYPLALNRIKPYTELWTLLLPPLQRRGHSCGVRGQPGFIPVEVAEGGRPQEPTQHACVGHQLVHWQHESGETCCCGDQTPHSGLCVSRTRQKYLGRRRVSTRLHDNPNRKLVTTK